MPEGFGAVPLDSPDLLSLLHLRSSLAEARNRQWKWSLSTISKSRTRTRKRNSLR